MGALGRKVKDIYIKKKRKKIKSRICLVKVEQLKIHYTASFELSSVVQDSGVKTETKTAFAVFVADFVNVAARDWTSGEVKVNVFQVLVVEVKSGGDGMFWAGAGKANVAGDWVAVDSAVVLFVNQ